MNSPRQKSWYFIAAILLSAGLLWLAIRGVSWADFINTLSGIQEKYLALAIGLSIVSLFTRGLRWGVLIRVEKPVPAVTTFMAAAAGYMGNNLLPARIGDVLRSFLLGRKTGIPGITVLATTVTERVLDVIALIVIGATMLMRIPNLPAWMPGTLRSMAMLGLVGMVVLFGLPFLAKPLRRLMAVLPIPESLRTRLFQFFEQFLRGARSFMHPGRAVVFLGLTALIWLLDGFGTTLAVRGLSLSLSLPEALLLLVALGLSSALPSTPGYIGVYQFVAVTLLPVFGFTRSQAMAYIVLSQAINMLLTTGLGVVGLWYLGGRREDLSLSAYSK